MKLRDGLALSLAIGAPLWFRQLRWQRQRDKEMRAYAVGLNKEMQDYVTGTNKGLNRWLDDTEKALREALS
ncbi:MAG TPA: hypothetical protein VEW07_02255 [Solirubrobacterales bacterium]|nr:hypothetical protein [Solirubrobacterales bacterium]